MINRKDIPINEINKKYLDLIEWVDENNLSDKNRDNLIKYKKLAVEYKNFYDSLQWSAKELLNSVYGASAANIFRYFKNEVAESITGEGRFFFKSMDKLINNWFRSPAWIEDKEYIQELKSKEFGDIIQVELPKPIPKEIDLVVYGDTDSNYINGGEILKSLGIDPITVNQLKATQLLVYVFGGKLQDIFNKDLERIITNRNGENFMSFELELVGGRGVFLTKKKYIMTKYWEDGAYLIDKGKFKSTGIELAQSSTPTWVRNMIEKIVRYFFKNWGRIDQRKFNKIIRSVIQNAKNLSINDISKIVTMGKYSEYVINDKVKPAQFKELKKGGSIPQGVRASVRYNQLLREKGLQNKYPLIKDGTKYRIYYDSQHEAMAYPDGFFPKEILPSMDVEFQLDKVLFPAVKRIVGGMIDTKRIKDKSFQSSFDIKKKR